MGDNNPWSVQQAETDGTKCLLTYSVRITGSEMTNTLEIANTGTSSFGFQALLHTYFAIDNGAAQDKTKTFVKGLGGYSIVDKVTGTSGVLQSHDEPVVLEGETDRVFLHPENHPVVHAVVQTGGSQSLRLEAAGQVDDAVSTVSAVVWNPGQEKAAKMSDFGNDQFTDMICVEPGLIGHQPLLAPGATARLSQSIIVLDA
jgi:glucose-6-phosphate 1-epimerase